MGQYYGSDRRMDRLRDEVNYRAAPSLIKLILVNIDLECERSERRLKMVHVVAVVVCSLASLVGQTRAVVEQDALLEYSDYYYDLYYGDYDYQSTGTRLQRLLLRLILWRL